MFLVYPVWHNCDALEVVLVRKTSPSHQHTQLRTTAVGIFEEGSK